MLKVRIPLLVIATFCLVAVRLAIGQELSWDQQFAKGTQVYEVGCYGDAKHWWQLVPIWEAESDRDSTGAVGTAGPYWAKDR